MDAHRWRHAQDLLELALHKTGPDRESFLSEACGDDAALRAQVESLLAASDSLDAPPRGMPKTPLRAGTRLGPYEIEALIDAGGMGEVYKGRDTRLNRKVAIKTLPSHYRDDLDRRRRFEREALAISALAHPHICVLYDVGQYGEVDFLVMEYLEGETLARRLNGGALPIDQVLRYAIEMADALDRAHRQGIVHRDLKPGNVMVTKSGIKLLDFGLAKLRGPVVVGATAAPTATDSITAEGSILGTLPYMAPEQLDGHDADVRTDIFAFGAIIYEMATGQPAFQADSSAKLIGAILKDTPPPISTIQPLAPPLLDRVVATCLAKDPDDRWQTARDLTRELKWVQETASQAVGALRANTPSPRRQGPIIWAAAITGVVVAAVALIVIATRSPAPDDSVVRFTIPPPPDVAFTPASSVLPGTQLAVSPDGRAIAFVAAPAGGRFLVWVRKLHETDAKVVPGTAGARYPFWSPNGSHIGYFSEGKLKTVDLSGGHPQVLAAAPDGRGGAWSRTGQILFSPDSSEALYQISERGGSPTQVTTLDRSRREKGHRWPQFLPDGREFLFFVDSDDAQLRGIYHGSLDRAAHRLLMASGFHGLYAEPEHLLYVRDGNLVAQSITRTQPGISGLVSTLVRGVGGAGNGYGSYSVSDTGVLIHAAPFAPERELVFFSRSGERLERVDGPSDYVDFRLGADGRIAVARNRSDLHTSDIFVIDRRLGTEHRLTMHPALDASPVWSPDSTRLVFRSKRRAQATDNPNDLYDVSTDGSGKERLLLSTPVGKYPTDWSPDGRAIIYHTQNVQTGWDVWILPLGEDPTPTPLLAGTANEMQGKLSPDGRWIAFTSDASGRPEVYVKSFPPDDRVWQLSTGGGSQPLWTQNGHELVFVAPDGMLLAASVETGSQFHIQRVRPQFRIPAPGFDPPFSAYYAMSADGRKVLVNASRRDGGVSGIEVIVNWRSLLAGTQ